MPTTTTQPSPKLTARAVGLGLGYLLAALLGSGGGVVVSQRYAQPPPVAAPTPSAPGEEPATRREVEDLKHRLERLEDKIDRLSAQR